jgi:hypothetical protein
LTGADTADWRPRPGCCSGSSPASAPRLLLPGVDPIDTAIVTRLLDALASRIHFSSTSTGTGTGTDTLVGQCEPGQQVNGFLDDCSRYLGLGRAGRVLRRNLTGERDPDALLPA